MHTCILILILMKREHRGILVCVGTSPPRSGRLRFRSTERTFIWDTFSVKRCVYVYMFIYYGGGGHVKFYLLKPHLNLTLYSFTLPPSLSLFILNTLLLKQEAARAYDQRAGPMGRQVNFPETAPPKDPSLCEFHINNSRASQFVGVRRIPGATKVR
jgi:hypothetical protein